MPERQSQRRSREPGGDAPSFRYTAVVLGTGEIPEIVESVGRRTVRSIDAAGAEGRRLLASGVVHLWRDPLDRPERMPVEQLFAQLQASTDRDEGLHPEDERWREACRRRRENLRYWRARYCDRAKLDH